MGSEFNPQLIDMTLMRKELANALPEVVGFLRVLRFSYTRSYTLGLRPYTAKNATDLKVVSLTGLSTRCNKLTNFIKLQQVLKLDLLQLVICRLTTY